MVQRRDTGVTRHAGGWIVLGSGLLAVCLFGAWMSEGWSPRSENRPAASRPPQEFPELRIDINQADEAELSCIAGIGPAIAHRIVEHRQRIGRFRTLKELDEVPGVGPQLARQLRSAVQHLPETESDIAVAEAAQLVRRHIQLPSDEALHD